MTTKHTPGPDRPFVEKYAARSTFFRLLGDAGRILADAYAQADLENQATIDALVFEAMAHSLIEHHGYTAEEINARAAEASLSEPQEG